MKGDVLLWIIDLKKQRFKDNNETKYITYVHSYFSPAINRHENVYRKTKSKGSQGDNL